MEAYETPFNVELSFFTEKSELMKTKTKLNQTGVNREPNFRNRSKIGTVAVFKLS